MGTPSIARAALRRNIIDLRIAAGLDQSDVSASLGVHADTVRRWETGEIALRTANVIALAHLFKATPEQLTWLTTLAGQAKEKSAVEKFKGGADPEFSIYADFEPTARVIWTYEPEYLPGLIQTSDYLRAVHAAHLPEQVKNPEAVHQLRTSRHVTLFTRTDMPEMRFLIGVAAMHYLQQLPPEVRDPQIQHLLDIDAMPTAKVRVITVMHPSMSGGYTLLTPASGIDAARFVYFEGERVMRYEEGTDVVSHHDKMFRTAWSRALKLKESI